jgi:hypothetical protein
MLQLRNDSRRVSFDEAEENIYDALSQSSQNCKSTFKASQELQGKGKA